MKSDNLSHIGVLGMKWGHRKQQGMSDKTARKKVAKAEKGWNKVKDKPISDYMKRKQATQRARKAAAVVLLAYFFGPALIRSGTSGVSLGKRKITDYMNSRKFEKYGGFDPKKVVNSKMWDAPQKVATTLLLGKGG